MVQLFAYNPIGQFDELLVWVGVIGVVAPPAVSFQIGNQDVNPLAIKFPFEPLGDEVRNHFHQPLNHRAIFSLPWPATNERFHITVSAGNQQVSLSSKRPQQLLPGKNEQGFTILLTSCYYQPNDRALALAQLVKTIKPTADFTLLAGDQVYLDLPSQQSLPRDKTALAQTLGKKYQLNWFADEVNQPGLSGILRHGPVLCVPDDHEYWNNFPFFQAQLNNTHCAADRANWQDVARILFERYQMSPAQSAGFFRWDITPLSMLFVDGRTWRDADGEHMFNTETRAAIDQWKNDLLLRKKANQPAVGLLSSGQALVIEKPGFWDRQVADMEMINYRDYTHVRNTLFELFIAGVPILYITGDVHWGRILEGKNMRGKTLFYEVIASPSRLIDTLGSDQKKMIEKNIRAFFGESMPFPKHPEAPDRIPDIKLANLKMETLHKQTGDHVALLRFHAIPGGVEFSVDYVCTDPDENKRRQYSSSHGPFKLISQ